MKNYFLALVISAFVTLNITAEEVEEVVVTSSLTLENVSDLKDPLHVISGDDIVSSGSQSLGESLDDLLGVYSADFGAGVGQPVIRGMSGSRVRILENGVVVRDVAALGPDHINDVNLSNVQQIEVVRGPSSLLYANGGSGGVINIVDNSIAQTDFLEPEINLGTEIQSVNDGDVTDFSYKGNLGGFNVTFVASDSTFGNYDLPADALYPEEHHDEDHSDSEGDEDHDEESLKFLENSDVENTYTKFGVSTTGDWGYVGFSYSDNEGVMGIPFHVEAHGEHDEDHSDSEGDEDHDEHEGERIFSQVDSNKLDIKGSFVTNGYPLVNKVDFSFRDSEYSHLEGHAEEEHHDEDHSESEDDEHGHEEPTLFKTDATEFGLIFDVGNETVTRKVVFNVADQDSSIIGEEAFMNPVASEETTLGYFASQNFGSSRYSLGFRYDQISRSGSVAHHDEDDHSEDEGEEELELYDLNLNTLSVAFNFDQDFTENLSVNLGLASFERAPDVVELFMNGPHLATGRFEKGDPDLDTETSNNIDVTFKYKKDNMYSSFTLYNNSVANYIYLKDEGEEEHTDEEGGHDEHEGELMHAEFVQEDAKLTGYEFEVGAVYPLGNGLLDLSFGRDVVEGTLDAGGFIPRMAPARNFYSASYVEGDYSFSMVLKDVDDHSDVSEFETMTEGYTMLNLKLVKDFDFGMTNLRVSAFANNALDQVARNSNSFVKDAVPLPGRNIGLRFNLTF